MSEIPHTTQGVNDIVAPGAPAHDGVDEPWWHYTKLSDYYGVAEQRQAREGYLDKPRHSINRDSELEGGVYEGAYGGEAIVADWGESLQESYDEIKAELGDAPTSEQVLAVAYRHVKERMKYDQEAVDRIFTEKARGVNHQKVALEVYIDEGVGVCRHQALFVGLLLEHLIKDGLLSGKVNVDRNMNRRANEEDKYDGHSWVRYTDSNGKVYIVDVAQHQNDTLQNLRQRRERGERIWNYARPEDLAQDVSNAVLREEKAQLGGEAQSPSRVGLRKGDTFKLSVAKVELTPGEVSEIAAIHLGDSELQVIDTRSAAPMYLPDGRQFLKFEGKLIPYREGVSFLIANKKTASVMNLRAGESFVIGRGKDEYGKEAAKRLGLSDDMAISREHARLTVNDAGNLVIEDMSANGTIVEVLQEQIDESGNASSEQLAASIEFALDNILNLDKSRTPDGRGKGLQGWIEGVVRDGQASDDDPSIQRLRVIASILQSSSLLRGVPGEVIEARKILLQIAKR